MLKLDPLLQFELTVITLKVKCFFNILNKSPWFTKIFPFLQQKYLLQRFNRRFIHALHAPIFKKLFISTTLHKLNTMLKHNIKSFFLLSLKYNISFCLLSLSKQTKRYCGDVFVHAWLQKINQYTMLNLKFEVTCTFCKLELTLDEIIHHARKNFNYYSQVTSTVVSCLKSFNFRTQLKECSYRVN